MTDYPRLVYRCPGSSPGFSGTTYDSLGVADTDALGAALKAGWFATMPEAVDAFRKPKLAPVAPPPTPEPEPIDAPPTRDEMLAKAAEINLTVDKRWSDKTLANKIIEALEAQEAELLTVPEEAPPQ
jgi:hypothetical protein